MSFLFYFLSFLYLLPVCDCWRSNTSFTPAEMACGAPRQPVTWKQEQLSSPHGWLFDKAPSRQPRLWPCRSHLIFCPIFPFIFFFYWDTQVKEVWHCILTHGVSLHRMCPSLWPGGDCGSLRFKSFSQLWLRCFFSDSGTELESVEPKIWSVSQKQIRSSDQAIW